jgi:hypothetical protein
MMRTPVTIPAQPIVLDIRFHTAMTFLLVHDDSSVVPSAP